MDPSLAVWVHDVDPSIAPGLPALLGERARVDPAGTIYFKIGPLDTDWALSPGSGGVPSAPGDATYWVSTANATLTAEVDMGALASGIVYQTVALGVSTPAIVTIGTGLSFAAPTLSVSAALLGGTFITQTPNADLTSEQALSLLVTGVLSSTTATGVVASTAFSDGAVPFGAGGILTEDVAAFSFNNAGNNLSVGHDFYLTGAASSSIDKSGAGTFFLGTSVAGGSLFMYTAGGTNSLVMDSAGVVTIGGTSGLVYTPSTNSFVIGTTLPVAGVAMQVNKDQNFATSLTFTNPNTGGSAYTNFILGQSTSLSTGSTFGMALFSTGSTFGSPYGVDIALLSKDSGTGNMHFWIDQNVGDFVWFTKATFPNPPERMKLTTAGVFSVNDLGAAGTGRLVKAAVTTGILSIATAAEVATAITWPTAPQILYSSGTGTAPVGRAGFEYDIGDDQFWLGSGREQGWYNLGDGPADTDYERVRAFWTGNVWTLKSEEAGTGTIRSMLIDADTAAINIAGDAGWSLTSTSVAITAETGGTGHNLTIVGNGAGAADGILSVNAWSDIGLLTNDNTSIALDGILPGCVVTAGPLVASGAAAVLDAILLSASSSISGTTTIATATGYNAVTIDQPVYSKSGAGAVTVTNAATLYIEGHPTAAVNVTITNKWALWVDSGLSRFDGDGTNVWEVPADATAGIDVTIDGRIPILVGGATKYIRYYND